MLISMSYIWFINTLKIIYKIHIILEIILVLILLSHTFVPFWGGCKIFLLKKRSISSVLAIILIAFFNIANSSSANGLQTLIIVPIINVFGLTVKIGLPLSMDPLVQVPQQQKTLRFFLMLVLQSMHILI